MSAIQRLGLAGSHCTVMWMLHLVRNLFIVCITTPEIHLPNQDTIRGPNVVLFREGPL